MFKISSVLFLGASVWRVTTARVSECMGIFLSELFDWLRTANSPILSSSRSAYPRSVEEHNASVR